MPVFACNRTSIRMDQCAHNPHGIKNTLRITFIRELRTVCQKFCQTVPLTTPLRVVRRPGVPIDQAQASEKAEMIICTNKIWPTQHEIRCEK
jgi:hypothetical protein